MMNANTTEKINAICNSEIFRTSYAMPANLDKLTEKGEVVLDKFAILDSLHKSGNATVTAIADAETAVKSALSELNKAIVIQWCDELKELSKEDAMKTYIDHAGELCAFKLSAPSKTNEERKDYAISAGLKSVSYATVNKHLNLASSTAWGVSLGRFVHNLALNLTSKENGINANAPKFWGTKADGEEVKFWNKYSKDALKKQMDLLAKQMRPENMEEIHFHSHDVNYILHAVTKATTGKSARIELAKEVATLNAIVTAMHFRTNDKQYDFQSKAKVHVKPNTK